MIKYNFLGRSCSAFIDVTLSENYVSKSLLPTVIDSELQYENSSNYEWIQTRGKSTNSPPVHFIVIDNQHDDIIILGLNFLRFAQGQLDFSNNIFSAREMSSNLIAYKGPTKNVEFKLMKKGRLYYQSRTTRNIHVKINQHSVSGLGCSEKITASTFSIKSESGIDSDEAKSDEILEEKKEINIP